MKFKIYRILHYCVYFRTLLKKFDMLAQRLIMVFTVSDKNDLLYLQNVFTVEIRLLVLYMHGPL